MDARSLRLGYSSIGENQCSVFGFRGGQISPLMHVAFSLIPKSTCFDKTMQFIKKAWFSSIVLLIQNIKLFLNFIHIYLTQNAHLRDQQGEPLSSSVHYFSFYSESNN